MKKKTCYLWGFFKKAVTHFSFFFELLKSILKLKLPFLHKWPIFFFIFHVSYIISLLINGVRLFIKVSTNQKSEEKKLQLLYLLCKIICIVKVNFKGLQRKIVKLDSLHLFMTSMILFLNTRFPLTFTRFLKGKFIYIYTKLLLSVNQRWFFKRIRSWISALRKSITSWYTESRFRMWQRIHCKNIVKYTLMRRNKKACMTETT